MQFPFRPVRNCYSMASKLTNPKIWGLGVEKKVGKKGRMPMHVCSRYAYFKVRERARDRGCLHIYEELYVLHTHPTCINRK